MPIPIPVVMDEGTPRTGGLLASARSLPANWERGISFVDTSCTLPVAMGECPTGPDLKPPQQITTDTFRPVELIQTIECTTLGGGVNNLAGPALDQTREFALAREMLTGEASARDAAIPENANPSLIGTAEDLIQFASTAETIACLEARLARRTAGRDGYILASVEWGTHLLADDVIWRDGGRWRTAYGTTVIISAGFDGRRPTATAPPSFGEPLYLYAVANIWAGIGQRTVLSDVNRSDNTATERAEDVAMVAFPTCAVFGASSSEVVSCGGGA